MAVGSKVQQLMCRRVQRPGAMMGLAQLLPKGKLRISRTKGSLATHEQNWSTRLDDKLWKFRIFLGGFGLGSLSLKYNKDQTGASKMRRDEI